jgi:hypothetical protein
LKAKGIQEITNLKIAGNKNISKNKPYGRKMTLCKCIQKDES